MDRRIVYKLETTHAMTEIWRVLPVYSHESSIELLIRCTDILIMAGYAASISESKTMEIS